MNLRDLHKNQKEVSAINFFKGETGASLTIQLKEKGVLKEHITKTPALLLCVEGCATYHDETGKEIELNLGDYINIEPNVKHSVVASKASQMILFK